MKNYKQQEIDHYAEHLADHMIARHSMRNAIKILHKAWKNCRLKRLALDKALQIPFDKRR